MIMDLYLFRHGESVANTLGIAQGLYDTELTKKGIEQAESLSSVIKEKNIQIESVYTSQLKRALKTAKIIAKNLEIKVIPHKNLHEVNIGDAGGKKKVEINKIYGEGILKKWNSINPEYENLCFPNGEIKHEARLRIAKTISEICLNYPKNSIGIVMHSFFINQLILSDDAKNYEKAKNCEIFHVQFNPKDFVENNPTAAFKLVKRIRTDV